MMHQVIEDRSRRTDSLVNGLFMAPKELKAVVETASLAPTSGQKAAAAQGASAVGRSAGTIGKLKEGYGFINPDAGGVNVFFFHSEVRNKDFSELHEGDKVSYAYGENSKGPCAIDIEVDF
jgi:CspA family cold shock protein